MKLLYKFASRQRPHKFFKCLDNIMSLVKHDDFLILCSLDSDDVTMTSKEVISKLSTYKKVLPIWGISTSKIHATNKDFDKVPNDWDIVINMADDVEWHTEGFDLKIIEAFTKAFKDTNGFLHIPDGIINEKLPTMAIMGKKLYDYFGYLYYPEYQNVYCDNEQFDVVKLLGVYHFEDIKLYTHNHPIWKLSEWDELYYRNENAASYAKDGELYRKRKEINFGINAA